MNDIDERVVKFFENEVDDPELLEALKEYWANRKELKRPLTVRAAKMALNRLEEMTKGNGAEKTSIVRQSVFYGWIGLFPVKDVDSSKYTNKRVSTNQFLQMLKEESNDQGRNY